MDGISDWIFLIVFAVGAIISLMSKVVSLTRVKEEQPKLIPSKVILKGKKRRSKPIASKKRGNATSLGEVLQPLSKEKGDKLQSRVHTTKSLIEEIEQRDGIKQDVEPRVEKRVVETVICQDDLSPNIDERSGVYRLIQDDLKSAIILNEILSPPKSLREDWL